MGEVGGTTTGAVTEVALGTDGLDTGAVAASPDGNKVCGRVARLRAAASVGKYKPPLWPQADTSMAHTTTPAAATQPRRFTG